MTRESSSLSQNFNYTYRRNEGNRKSPFEKQYSNNHFREESPVNGYKQGIYIVSHYRILITRGNIATS